MVLSCVVEVCLIRPEADSKIIHWLRYSWLLVSNKPIPLDELERTSLRMVEMLRVVVVEIEDGVVGRGLMIGMVAG